MKKFKKVFAVLLLMLLVTAPVVTAATQPVTVEAAAKKKTKLKKVKGKYYAYENGKKVCNKWRTIKVGKKKYRFYFDKKGRAYQANKAAMGKTGVLVKKIKGKYYGFDYQGHMVKGLRGGSTSAYSMPNLYFFNSKGVYDKKKTVMYINDIASVSITKAAFTGNRYFFVFAEKFLDLSCIAVDFGGVSVHYSFFLVVYTF